MAITAKKSFTLKKKDLTTSKSTAVGFRKTVAYHKATAGDASINLTALTLPTEMSSVGYTNPSTTALMAADLLFYKDNLALVSSARGYLQPGLSYNVTSNTNIVFSDSFGTALEDEIFTIIIDPVAKSGVEFVDGIALPVTGVLPAGQQDFNIGVPFEVNKFPTTQVGVYQIFYDGVLQSRNVGNADADPSADGNYQEIVGTGGLASLIRFNVIDNDNAHDIKCIPVGLMIERPSGSTRAELERQQGQINKIVEVLSDVAGTPESTFTAAPSEVDLKNFGDRVLAMESNRARIDQDNNWTAVQSLIGRTDGTSPGTGEIGEYTEVTASTTDTTTADTPVDVTGLSIILQPGRYWIGFDVAAYVLAAAVPNNIDAAVYITDSSNTYLNNTARHFSAKLVDTASMYITTSVSNKTVINITSPTTYKVRLVCGQSSATGTARVYGSNGAASINSIAGTTDNASKFWALRIG